jgi:hypothetical protein
MKIGGLFNQDKAKDLAMGTGSRQSELNFEVGRWFGWILVLPCMTS